MDGSKIDDACCENCFYASTTDIDGLVYCDLDARTKDDDMLCNHWTRNND